MHINNKHRTNTATPHHHSYHEINQTPFYFIGTLKNYFIESTRYNPNHSTLFINQQHYRYHLL